LQLSVIHSVIPALRRLGLEDHEFENLLGYVASASLKKKETKKGKKKKQKKKKGHVHCIFLFSF
jgi:hypothetical protein